MATSLARDVALANKMCRMEENAPKKGCSVERQLELEEPNSIEKYRKMAEEMAKSTELSL